MTVLRNIFIAASLILILPAIAIADVFTVSNVKIDGSAESLAEARRNAIRSGTEQAANIMVDRLTLLEDRLAVNWRAIDADTASQLVAGIQISNEQRSTRRYLGVLQVSFDWNLVRDFLNANNLPFVETQTAPALIVPVWVGAQDTLLWQENPFWRVWRNGTPENDLTPLTLPLGDLGDQASLSTEQALRLDTTALAALAARYDVKRVLVAIAYVDGPGQIQVKLNTFNWNDQGRPVLRQMRIYADGSWAGSGAVALRSAAENARQQIISRLQRDWKLRSVVRADTVTGIRLMVRYSNLSEWVRLREILASSSLVREARLEALSADGALMTINYVGTAKQLASQLAQEGVSFVSTDLGPVAQLH